MDDVLEGAVCGIDGCVPAAFGQAGPASGAKATLAIEVISDAICPWCWVAKRRLDRALEALAPDITASVTWRPFELNPGCPRRAWTGTRTAQPSSGRGSAPRRSTRRSPRRDGRMDSYSIMT